jgi:uncharacterized protein with HEPN domain
MKVDAVYLRHILECIDRIERYTTEGRAAFLASTLLQDGVLRNLQTLGQSVLKLSEPLKASHPEVDWKNIVGFRNVLVHDYLGVYVARVWEIVERDVPDLKAKVAAIHRTIPSA